MSEAAAVASDAAAVAAWPGCRAASAWRWSRARTRAASWISTTTCSPPPGRCSSCSWRRPSSPSIWSSPCSMSLDRGGIANARPGSFADAFFFSVQTLGTLGYGVMAPRTLYTNLLVTVESFTGILTIALFTGIIFARFSRPFARVVFSKVAVVAPFDGVPTLMFRAANQRGEFHPGCQRRGHPGAPAHHPRRRHHAPLPGIEAAALQQSAVRAVLDGDASDRRGQPALRPDAGGHDRAGHGDRGDAERAGRNHGRPHLCPPCLLGGRDRVEPPLCRCDFGDAQRHSAWWT